MTALAGVHDTRQPGTVAQLFPGASVGREFVAGVQTATDLRPKFDKLTGPWLTEQGSVYVSFKPRVADVVSGAWRPWLRRLGEWLAAHPGVKVIVWHEPENDLPGPDFAATFNACRTDIKTGCPDAVVAYCAMAYQWRPGGVAAGNPAGWTDAVADEYLVDVYSGVSFPAGMILPEHPGFTGWYNSIVRPRQSGQQSIAWGVAERGFQAKDPNIRADTIRREAAWLAALSPDPATAGAFTRPMLYLAWNTGGTEADPGWLLDPSGEDAMRFLLASILTPAAPPDIPAQPAPVTDRYARGYADGFAAALTEMTAWARQRLPPTV